MRNIQFKAVVLNQRTLKFAGVPQVPKYLLVPQLVLQPNKGVGNRKGLYGVVSFA